MGVIGDLILHKGRSFLSLASLVSALQADGDSSIVLNQKIITQDNKNSTIFVGDNIPFTGSIVQTTGASQQTTANVEYRDIGMNLSITPKLGEGDVITLDLDEEITEALPTGRGVSSTHVSGIQTTKTNMRTHVHVPNKHFLVLSGMIRNAKSKQKVGLPCLGGLPWIGAAFSKTMKNDEKRNVIIFVRPHIIRSVDDYRQITDHQEELYKKLSTEQVIEEATALIK
jgi:type III secretion protein C